MEKNNNLFNKLLSHNIFILIFLLILTLLAYHSLFTSYFESDEWFYFTYYFPLTKADFGMWTAVSANFTNSGYISGGQHVVPIASLIYFINTKLFGLDFVPYAFLSLSVHALNSYFVFILIKTFLIKKSLTEKNFYAFLGSLFFTLSPIPMHNITGFAAFYGQNVLSVTFFILCILFYERYLIEKANKFISLTILFLFLALLTKEATVFLFLVLLVMTFFRNKTYPIKFLATLYVICIMAYAILRFLVPYISDKITHFFTDPPGITQVQINTLDPGLSIYPNLYSELLFRSIAFPLRMLGSIFVPSDTILYIVKRIAPAISPYPPGGDATVQVAFINYSGQSMIMYLLALALIVFGFITVKKSLLKKRYDEARYLLIGFSIILFGALPLVAIIYTFPRWGYEIYFDSRHYYNPTVGAAILFPIIVFSLAKFISRILHIKKIWIPVLLVLSLWFISGAYTFKNNVRIFTQNFSQDRKNIVNQMTHYLPELKSNTVFYIETDKKGPFESLPFFTSVPQALTVVYYNRNGLPNSFYNKPLFNGKPQGYQYEEDRGFGYYTSKEKLVEGLQAGSFTTNDVYAFYYYGKEGRIEDITSNIREELNK